ncbi:hypothetical protein [Nocardia vaccinii]|uniref:hypothetical protein n=1 Tax=Nocardia vaccinii TaxID=1822 RepID=UPI00082E536E|nr:hypothetical protein [Nocardia vaccinii]
MSDVHVSISLNLAAALDEAQIVLVIRPSSLGPEGYQLTYFERDEIAVPSDVVAHLLRQYADQHAQAHATQSSPDADQETVRPAQADPLHAPGSTPN